jgi:hypothetical protein
VRTIRTQTGDLMGLSYSLPYPINSGDTFSVYPGCRKRFEADCVSKYNNSSAYLGFPWMPKPEHAF